MLSWPEHIASLNGAVDAPVPQREPPMPPSRVESTFELMALDEDELSQMGEGDERVAAWRDWLRATGRLAAISAYLDEMPCRRKASSSLGHMARCLQKLEAAGFDIPAIEWAWEPDGRVAHYATFPDCLAPTAR